MVVFANTAQGIDLTRLAAEHKFVFMDGLTELFSHESSQAPAPTVLLGGRSPASHASHFIPTAKRQPPTSHHAAPVRQHGYQKPSGTTRLRWSKTGRLEAIERDVVSAIDSLDSTSSDENRVPATDNVLLVIDQPDLLLAATGSSLGIGAQEIRDMIMNLRQVCPIYVLMKILGFLLTGLF